MQFDTKSIWLYVHFPRLQLNIIEAQHSCANTISKEQSTLPQLNKALAQAVYHSSHNQLIQINQAAERQGLQCGMGLAKASLMHKDLRIHEYKPQLEENALEQLAQQLYLVSADIVIDKPNGLILRAQNMLKLYGNLHTYWQVIQYCINKTSYEFVAASGYSVPAAKLIALHAKKNLIIEDKQKLNQLLDGCSLAYTSIDAKDLNKLARVGIKDVQALKQVPTAELASRVNRHSMNTINELLGLAASKVKFYQPSTQFHSQVELLYEVENIDKLLPLIEQCLQNLSQFLCVRNARCLQIKIELKQRDTTSRCLHFESALPIYKSRDWLEIVSLKFERIRLEAPVIALSLHCDQYETTQISSDDLFLKRSNQIAGLSLISRLISKLGEEKVKGITYINDYRPESSSQYIPFTSTSKRSKEQIQFDRPSILLTPAILTQQVTIIKGPERLNTAWWEGEDITRDYYIGESQHGQRMWIYKTPDNEWYLHGLFC
ncbi:Y-family DNA polymerase [Agaribacter flavus]|uniref:Y-family DNA polymerase n=1 Tax=Agaribacter flavus TaxID=1902781 RepID=A0ABV7FRV5_9ALTE